MSAPPDTSDLQRQFASGVGMPKAVSLSLIGMSVDDRQRLLDAFARIPSGRLVYTLVPLSLRPDILVVNADDTRALAMWVRYRNYIRQLGAVPPSIVVSRFRTFDTAHYQLRSPIDSMVAVDLLDCVTSEKLGIEDTVLLPLLNSPRPFDARAIGSSDSARGLDATAMPSGPVPGVITGRTAVTAQPGQMQADSADRLSLTATQNGFSGGRREPEPAVRALVVDDSLPVRIQMRQALQPLSWQVDYAENGEQALPLLDANDYDIIFLDVVMPGIDGYDVCRHAKGGRHRDTPVIMLTSASSPADRVKGKLAGCNTYLIKPVTPPVLRQLIEQYLSIR